MLMYSGASFVRPPFLHRKSDPFKRGGTPQGYISIHLCLDLHCQLVFPDGLASIRVASQKGFHCVIDAHKRFM